MSILSHSAADKKNGETEIPPLTTEKSLESIFYCGVSLKIGGARFYFCFGSDCENFSSFLIYVRPFLFLIG